jgi:hypothetical protein
MIKRKLSLGAFLFIYAFTTLGLLYATSNPDGEIGQTIIQSAIIWIAMLFICPLGIVLALKAIRYGKPSDNAIRITNWIIRTFFIFSFLTTFIAASFWFADAENPRWEQVTVLLGFSSSFSVFVADRNKLPHITTLFENSL